MFSIICIFNNKEVLDNLLLASLKEQTSPYELILLDNTTRKYKSASNALNQGARDAKGDYLMFVHQDVSLVSRYNLKYAEEVLAGLPNLGAAGVAGNGKNGGYSIIHQGTPPRPVPNYSGMTEPIRTQTLDECLVIIPRSVFKAIQFDERTCDDWHLYSVDYCLSLANLELNVYVIPMYVYHQSIGVETTNIWQEIMHLGPYSEGYYQTLKKLIAKHGSHHKIIYTTIRNWNTYRPLLLQRIMHLANYLVWSMLSTLVRLLRVVLP
jgi:GT2 family glycosyltransferase